MSAQTTAAATGTITGLGAPADRVDGRAKTTGAARFSAEYPAEKMAYAALAHATIAHGRITHIDVTAAQSCPGVLLVLTHLNAPKLKPTPKPGFTSAAAQATSSTINYLNTDEVHYDGQPVAIVVADSIDAAQEAVGLIKVTYQPRPSAVDFIGELDNAEPLKGPPIGIILSGRHGDAATTLTKADVVVDEHYTTPEHNHNALEPHSTTAIWTGEHLTLYEGSQNIQGIAQHLARKFGMPAKNVRVVSQFVGGAFGGKSHVWPATLLAVLAAREAKRPVQLMLTREGVYRTVGGRTATSQRVALGADHDGHLRALIHTATTRLGTAGGHPEQVTSCSHDLYAADAILHEQKAVKLNLVPNTFMRAPGEAVGTFALESAIDEMAHKLGIDPVEFRLINQSAKGPVNGNRFTHHSVTELLRLGAERFGWSSRSPQPGTMRDGNHLVGLGMAVAYHPANLLSANLTVTLTDDGHAHVRCGFHEMGMGSATAVAQMTGHLLGLPHEHVTVEYGDTDLPVGPPAGLSSQTASIAAGLTKACQDIIDQVAALARRSPTSPLHRAGRATVEARDGGLHNGEKGESYHEILTRSRQNRVDAQVGSDTGLGAMVGQVQMAARMFRDGRRISRAATGAHFCEVRIDADTGEIRIARWFSAFDIGRVVNAKIAASQLRGGIIMGLGMAMSEATLIDPRNGRIMNPSLTEYHLPVHADVPAIDIHILDDPDTSMPLGVVGAGEVGITGVAAAVANAIFHASGRRIRDLPITLDTVVM